MRNLAAICLIMIMAVLALPAGAEAWKTYVNEYYGFSLDYPEDWAKQIDENSLITLTSPDELMPVVMTIMTEPVEEGEFEDGYSKLLESAINDIQSQLDIFTEDLVRIENRGEVDLNGLPAYRFDLVIELLDFFSMRMANTLVRLEGNLLILSFAADTAIFDSHSETFDAIRSSFRLVGSQSGEN
ncbi:MAG: hypothetical protein K0B87_07620 [Candidatus Syntrophosphaera sp.]|nr:hypothetical protein [Candidatus Syntrophosphaera sp.]